MADLVLLVTEKDAAAMLGLSTSTLIASRFRKKPLLPFVRVGLRTIRYRITDIHAFIDRNRETPAMAKPKRKPKVDTDAEAEKARDAVDEFCTPDRMTKAEAVMFYETLIGWFQSSVEALQEEIENER